MKRASRLQNIPPYHFARWAARVQDIQRQGVDVIRLDVGNPDMPPSDEVIDALCQSAHRPDYHGYPGYRGSPALLNAITEYYERRFDVLLDPQSQIVPLVGSKGGIILIALALLDSGDVTLIPDPGYAPYASGTTLAGAQVYNFPLLAERDFLPDFDAIPSAVADKAVLMWLNYPNNPTGATADLEFFAQAVEFAQRHDLLICHDAPYCDVTYDGYVAPSILQVDGASKVAVEFNSLSKTCNMAGWRVGMAVGNVDALASLAQLKSNLNSGIFRPLQEAGARALSVAPEWFSTRNEVYRERLGLIVDGLNAAGMGVPCPRATLYVWTRIPSGWASSEEFALALLEQAGVSVAPGSFFGPAGEGYVRIAATAPTEQVRKAMERLCRFAA
ncbi:MAG: aminotransferase class I/II-fold pyridoxal phosphate-dependent enzyme [Chloroflexi bacterium]|nr:aminotransferase class I/II-fold pyridoxal phosphate-dependent enzyme [Chloroflexota bacterium]